MIDRENVIKGLEHCLHGEECCDDMECPYFIEHWSDSCCLEKCQNNLKADALALLKDQKPKVMKLEDVKAFGWDYCYLEEERLPGKEYRTVCGDYALTCITWPCITSMRIQYGDESYGKKWRCWSAKPTDEQRKAVKWK